MSDEGLTAALLRFQSEVGTLVKDKTAKVRSQKGNYEYAYLSLDSIMEAIQPALTKHELVWMALPVGRERGIVLHYRLVHAPTGDALDGELPLLMADQGPQAMGSALTYARRYAITSVLNLVADEDDDGRKAQAPRPARDVAQAPQGTITESQQTRLRALISRAQKDGMKGPVLRALLDEQGLQDVKLEAGWMKQLSTEQATAVIDELVGGFLPDPAMASDVPTD